MSEIVNQLAAQTGISSELIQKGLGALLSFLKKELGEETFTEVESSVPGAANHLKTFEEAPERLKDPADCWEWSLTSPVRFSGEKPEQAPSCWQLLSKLGLKPRADREFPAQGSRVDQEVSFA